MSGPPVQLSPRHWETVAAILRRHVPGREVWAFGSRARGSARTYSDLDLAVVGEAPLSLPQLAALAGDFEDSALPFKVDIVDWATASESFRAVIKSGRVVVQPAASPPEDPPPGAAGARKR